MALMPDGFYLEPERCLRTESLGAAFFWCRSFFCSFPHTPYFIHLYSYSIILYISVYIYRRVRIMRGDVRAHARDNQNFAYNSLIIRYLQILLRQNPICLGKTQNLLTLSVLQILPKQKSTLKTAQSFA